MSVSLQKGQKVSLVITRIICSHLNFPPEYQHISHMQKYPFILLYFIGKSTIFFYSVQLCTN